MDNRPFSIKYPKLLLLLGTIILAYFLFTGKDLASVHDVISSLGYFGTFIAGLLFSYGFTAAPATALLLILAKEQSVVAAGLIAGLGALLSDLLIFKLVRFTLADEIARIQKEKYFPPFPKLPRLIQKYVVPVIAGLIIASPLPDEIGVSLLAASNTISLRAFLVISYVLNTTGIFIILAIGRMI